MSLFGAAVTTHTDISWSSCIFWNSNCWRSVAVVLNHTCCYQQKAQVLPSFLGGVLLKKKSKNCLFLAPRPVSNVYELSIAVPPNSDVPFKLLRRFRWNNCTKQNVQLSNISKSKHWNQISVGLSDLFVSSYGKIMIFPAISQTLRC